MRVVMVCVLLVMGLDAVTAIHQRSEQNRKLERIASELEYLSDRGV